MTLSAAERVERARSAAKMSQRALADATGISQPTLSRIIQGERTPKIPELLLIAQATGRAPAELLEASSVADRVRYAARSTTGLAMDEMERQLRHFVEIDAYLEEQGFAGAKVHAGDLDAPPTHRDEPPAGVSEREARERAGAFRTAHGLGVQPIGDLVTVIEQAVGIDVAIVDAPDDQHGLSMLDPQRGAVFIAVSRNKKPLRQRSTLAHELGHVLFGDWQSGQAGQGPKWVESRADAFARHLLVPEEGLELVLGPQSDAQHDLASLSAAVQRFEVSPRIAAIAMCEAGYITEQQKLDWKALHPRQLALRHGWLDHYFSLIDDANQTRAPQKLLTRAITGYVERVASAQTIATLRGVPEDIVLADLADLETLAATPAPAEGTAQTRTEPRDRPAAEISAEDWAVLDALQALDADDEPA